MGSTKIEQSSSGTQTATATPEEKQMEQLQLQQMQATNPLQTQVQKTFLNLANQLGTGTSPLPGFYGEMAQGISPQAISGQATELTRQALPQFQSQGLLDSGTMNQDIQSLIANQLLFPAEQFNIGAKQNLLNLALSGQAQVQQPVTANTGLLGNQLAGLRTITTQGTQQQTSNPFLNSFYSSLGKTLGSPSFTTGGGFKGFSF